MRFEKFLVALTVLILGGLLAIQVNAGPKGQGKGKGPKAPAPVPQTGQTTSYYPGDDGDLERGISCPEPRFTDNEDGTVTDNCTGLIWLKDANCDGAKTWAIAITFCNNLMDEDCGLTDGSTLGDWRLPNRKELNSLLDLGQHGEALPLGHPFVNVTGQDYWSSTTYDPGPSEAWYTEMYNGVVGATLKDRAKYVWPVRGGN